VGVRLGLLAAVAAVAAATCAGATGSALQTQARSVPRFSHVILIVFENHEVNEVLGRSDAPTFNRLASKYATISQYTAVAHPSLPNYLALVSGSTQGIDSDCTSCLVSGRSLADTLAASRKTWKTYAEGLPSTGFTGASSGRYAKKHNPFVYFRRNLVPARLQRIVPLTRFTADLRGRRLPSFSLVVPDLCHDMHDCDPAVGDRFLRTLVPPLLRALGPHGLLVVTFDEGSSDNGCCRLAAGGHILTILAGGLARRGARLSTPVDHYSTLQTIEDLTRVPRQGGAACACTPSLGRLLVGSARRASG